MTLPEKIGKSLHDLISEDLDWDEIRHITKVDPEKFDQEKYGEEHREALSGTDAVMISGSDGVTAENTSETLEALKDLDKITIQEPYRSSHVSEKNASEFDYIGVPSVINGNGKHLLGKHIDFYSKFPDKIEDARNRAARKAPLNGFFQEVAEEYAEAYLRDKFFSQAYVVQNKDSSVAELSEVGESMSLDEVRGVSETINTQADFDVMYIEYSGTYGDPEIVREASEHLKDTPLLYGGGIRSYEQAEEMLEAGADAVVVGDFFHDEPDRFPETIP